MSYNIRGTHHVSYSLLEEQAHSHNVDMIEHRQEEYKHIWLYTYPMHLGHIEVSV